MMPPQPSSPRSTDATASQLLAGQLAEIVFIVLVFFAIAGDLAPHVNEPHYLCRLNHYWNPDWCAGDLFLESRDAHLVFVVAFGWITKWLSLAATAWAGRILVWMLLAWAWQRLSWRVLPVPLASVLTAGVWVTLTGRMHLGGEWVVGGVEAKCFAYVFLLLALREMLDSRWNRVWLLLGAASAFHVLVGAWSVVVCGGIWILEKLRASREGQAPAEPPFVAAITKMLPGLICGGLLALFGALPALSLTWHESPEVVSEANRIYVFDRLPHHLAILTMPTDEVARRLIRHGVLLLILFGLAHVNRMAYNPELRRLTWFAWGAALLATAGLTIELALWHEPLRAAAFLKFYWCRLTDVAVPMAVALQSVSLLVAGLRERQAWAASALAIILAAVGWQIADASWQRFENPVPPSDRKMRDYPAWVALCDWVTQNTPPHALFITPRMSQSFKWRTGRPEVATWKDIPQDAPHMVEWSRRMRALYGVDFGNQIEPLSTIGKLGTARALALAKEFGADYIICDHTSPLALPVVYPMAGQENDEYVVYAIKDRSTGDGR